MTPLFFKNGAEMRKWFAKNHKTEKELLVGYHKVATGKASVSWSESVDEALCFGWIDGIRKSLDEHSYTIRFTPRKPNSIWSAINIAKVEVLTGQGLMLPEGVAAFEKRQAHKSGIYSYEKEDAVLDKECENKLKLNRTAKKFFDAQAPSYKKVAIHWVMSAK